MNAKQTKLHIKRKIVNIKIRKKKLELTKKACFCDRYEYYNANIESIIKMQKFFIKLLIIRYNMSYYISSLVYCEYQINTSKDKALKDVVGNYYENHIKRVYFYYTRLNQTTDYKDYGFTPDCCMIDTNNNIKVVTEIKGHYLDSCFLERALVGIVKSINTLNKQKKNIPYFEIHSFTTYNLFTKKLNEFKDIIDDTLSSILDKKLVYTTICHKDRLKKEKWFNKSVYKQCYLTNINYVHIIDHIKFLLSIK